MPEQESASARPEPLFVWSESESVSPRVIRKQLTDAAPIWIFDRAQDHQREPVRPGGPLGMPAGLTQMRPLHSLCGCG